VSIHRPVSLASYSNPSHGLGTSTSSRRIISDCVSI